MVRQFLILFLCLVAVNISAAHAGEIFNKKEKASSDAAGPYIHKDVVEDAGVNVSSQVVPSKAADGNVDNELQELIDVAPEPPPEKKPITINEFANQYHKNCMKQDHPLLKGEDKEMMCSCTAAQIPGNMTPAQMQAMTGDNEEGKTQRARMMMFVYAPCIKYPTRALIHNQCTNNVDVQQRMKNPDGICDCMSDDIAAFMRDNAPQHIEKALRENRETVDPMREMMESKGFEQTSQKVLIACIQKHELGIGR